MDFYHLIPEDRDAILEIDMGIKLPQISPSIKRALSRRYVKCNIFIDMQQ